MIIDFRAKLLEESLCVTHDLAANFSEDELGQQLLDVVLEPGDLLYFPRGFIHQVITDLHAV